jgi:hypothetical protein
MTIDVNLHALPMHDLAFLPGCGLRFLDDICIVEVKYRVAMPAIFKQLAETFGLDVVTMSKFRGALRALDYPLAAEPHEDEAHPLTAAEADAAGRFID